MAFVGLHIHKTAGTSLLRYFEKHASRRIYGAYALRNYRLLELPLWASANITSRDIFWGHSIYESFFYDVAEPIKLFTFLRHPNDRIISWYNMLKRRNKLKKAVSFTAFATLNANSISRMLTNRFPSLISSSTASLSDQAISVLDKMAFVGFQEHYSSHLPALLEWMKAPLCVETLNTYHNKAKTSPNDNGNNIAILNKLNEQDLRLYALAYERYGEDPLHSNRECFQELLSHSTMLDRAEIKKHQTKAAQKAFVNSLRYSLGDAGLEFYIRNLSRSYLNCEHICEQIMSRSQSKSEKSRYDLLDEDRV